MGARPAAPRLASDRSRKPAATSPRLSCRRPGTTGLLFIVASCSAARPDAAELLLAGHLPLRAGAFTLPCRRPVAAACGQLQGRWPSVFFVSTVWAGERGRHRSKGCGGWNPPGMGCQPGPGLLTSKVVGRAPFAEIVLSNRGRHSARARPAHPHRQAGQASRRPCARWGTMGPRFWMHARSPDSTARSLQSSTHARSRPGRAAPEPTARWRTCPALLSAAPGGSGMPGQAGRSTIGMQADLPARVGACHG